MNSLMVLLYDKIKFGDYEIIDFSSFIELFFRFGLNLLVVLILARWLYYTTSKRKDYLFTYILISAIIFLLCYLLESVKIQLGFALGLFAIFGIIRYRTAQIPIKEMTYLFMIIGVSVINSLFSKKTGVAEVLFTNLMIIGITYGFEKVWLLKHESAKTIVYEKIEFIKPENYNLLHADLTERTGLNSITRIEVGRIDFLRDTCRLKIYYEESGRNINQADLNDASSEGGSEG